MTVRETTTMDDYDGQLRMVVRKATAMQYDDDHNAQCFWHATTAWITSRLTMVVRKITAMQDYDDHTAQCFWRMTIEWITSHKSVTCKQAREPSGTTARLPPTQSQGSNDYLSDLLSYVTSSPSGGHHEHSNTTAHGLRMIHHAGNSLLR